MRLYPASEDKDRQIKRQRQERKRDKREKETELEEIRKQLKTGRGTMKGSFLLSLSFSHILDGVLGFWTHTRQGVGVLDTYIPDGVLEFGTHT